MEALEEPTSPGGLRQGGIRCPMILDLELQELVHRNQRARVVRFDCHLPASLRRLKRVGDGALPFLHYIHPRRNAIMDEHGKIKVVVPEHGCDMLQMRPNFLARSIIMVSLDFHFNDSAVRQKQKVMICRFV